MNSFKRRALKEAILKRDGPNCYICNKPWYDGKSDDEILLIAAKHSIFIPDHLNGSKIQYLRNLDILVIRMLVLEHEDNLKGDQISNLRLAHQKCNIKKDPPGHPRKRNYFKHFEIMSMNRGMEENEILKNEFKTLQRNIEMEPRFVIAGNQLLKKYGTIPIADFIAGACQDAKNDTNTISPPTGMRYFSKYANRYAKTAIWEVIQEDIPGVGKIGMVRLKEKQNE